MRLHIEYRSRYDYDAPVRESQNELRACPAHDDGQRVERYRVEVEPMARVFSYVDIWGTRVDTFGVRMPHETLEIRVDAIVETSAADADRPAPRGADPVPIDGESSGVFLARSPHVAWDDAIAREGRRLVAGADSEELAARALCDEVASFEYAPGETYVGVGVAEVFASRRGVCQDFAHVLVSLCRAVGLPSRYVSGYLHADEGLWPSDGATMALQTHAWAEVLVDGAGWLPLDPTSGSPVGERHVVIGRGRDYDDVAPLRGIYAGAAEQAVDVAVRIREQEQAMQRAAQQ